MKIKIAYLILFISFLTYSCNSSQKKNNSDVDTTSVPDQTVLAEGFQLVENNCFSCHSPNAKIDNRIAPPMEAIKKHYFTEGITQEQFTEDFITFLNDPSEANAKMTDAVKQFNLMPKMNFNEDQITKIATYIYHSEIEKPDWFDKHYLEEKQKYSKTAELSPLEQGQSIAMKTKGVLGKNLLEAINSKGTEHALAFCSTKAIPLTDSMSMALNAKIKRVSDKNRNPQNQANEDELAYIQKTKLAITNGDQPAPQITTLGGKHIGYYPIMTGKMCMQCHGQENTEILPNTILKIKEHYPNDKAIGYDVNELRGIWVVEMEKK